MDRAQYRPLPFHLCLCLLQQSLRDQTTVQVSSVKCALVCQRLGKALYPTNVCITNIKKDKIRLLERINKFMD